jgi:hypothetical protein
LYKKLANLFYTRGFISLRGSRWIIIALLLFSATGSAQETPPGQDKFYIGTEFQNETLTNLSFYPPFYESGMNTILQRADSSTIELIGDYNILAANSQHKEDWIHHYTTGYYSKWEAENQTDEDRVGVKHKWGQQAFWNDTVSCWSTIGLTEPKQNVIYGPYYRQDRRYKRWLYDWANIDSVRYNVRFNLALNYDTSLVSPGEDVCIIKAIYTYKEVYSNDSSEFFNEPFLIDTLKIGEFNVDGSFKYFNFDGRTYKYPQRFFLPTDLDNRINPPQLDYLYYTDSESFTGIQFCVDWLRGDTLCTLYIDYVEVYDNNGWDEYVDPATHNIVINRIRTSAQNYNNLDWQNIKHWVGVDEPYSIDCYEPIRVVDELVRSVNPNKSLIVAFNPTWWYDHKVNGEDEVLQFYNRANPNKITLSVNPCDARYASLRKEEFDWLQFNLQRTSALDHNFWFNAQTMGYRRPYNNGWCTWRKPDSLELRSMVMLALAHGAKGIIFKWFDSYYTYSEYCAPNELVRADCIVDPDAQPTSLYNEIKINLAPRLTGKLGNTLKELNLYW